MSDLLTDLMNHGYSEQEAVEIVIECYRLFTTAFLNGWAMELDRIMSKKMKKENK